MITHEKHRTSGLRPGHTVFGGAVIVTTLFGLGIVVLKLIQPLHGCGIQRTPDDLNRFAESIAHYHDEYGKLPKAPSSDFETEGPEAAELITVLRGEEEIQQMQNPRQIAFLTMRISKHKKQGGLVLSSDNKAVGIYDAWGNPLRVILRPPDKTVHLISYRGKQVTNSQPAVVLSRGADQKWGTKDDLISNPDRS